MFDNQPAKNRAMSHAFAGKHKRVKFYRYAYILKQAHGWFMLMLMDLKTSFSFTAFLL